MQREDPEDHRPELGTAEVSNTNNNHQEGRLDELSEVHVDFFQREVGSSSCSGSSIDLIKERSIPYPLYLLSGVFVLLFAAFFPLQNFLTSVLNDSDGFIALAILYASFCLATNIAPTIVHRLGLKTSMMTSAFLYTLLHFAVALAASDHRTLAPRVVVMLTSAGCGLGAAILWTAHGTYCVAISQHFPISIERTQSFFMSMESSAGIFGFGLALFLIDGLHAQDTTVLWTVAFISLGAVAAFGLLLPPLSPIVDPDKRALETHAQDGASATAACRKFLDMLCLFQRKDVLLLAFSVFHLGCQEGLFWGVVAQQMGSSLLAQSFLLHGICSVGSCAFFGSQWLEKRAPRWSSEGKASALVLVSMLGLATATIALHPNHSQDRSSSTLLLLATVTFGISDFESQALLRASMGNLFTGSPLLEASCSNILFTLTLGNILMFCVGPITPGWWQALFVGALGFISCACLLRGRGSFSNPMVQIPPAVVGNSAEKHQGAL